MGYQLVRLDQFPLQARLFSRKLVHNRLQLVLQIVLQLVHLLLPRLSALNLIVAVALQQRGQWSSGGGRPGWYPILQTAAC